MLAEPVLNGIFRFLKYPTLRVFSCNMGIHILEKVKRESPPNLQTSRNVGYFLAMILNMGFPILRNQNSGFYANRRNEYSRFLERRILLSTPILEVRIITSTQPTTKGFFALPQAGCPYISPYSRHSCSQRSLQAPCNHHKRYRLMP